MGSESGERRGEGGEFAAVAKTMTKVTTSDKFDRNTSRRDRQVGDVSALRSGGYRRTGRHCHFLCTDVP